MSWQRTHRRHRLVHDVLDHVGKSGPAAVHAWSPAIEAEFGGLGAFLAEVQRRWYATFDAHLDGLLEQEVADLPAAVARLWRTVTRRQYSANVLLEAYADAPALEPGARHHRRALLHATGVDQRELPTARATTRCPIVAARRRRAATSEPLHA